MLFQSGVRLLVKPLQRRNSNMIIKPSSVTITFTSTLNGLVPASGGGTTNFLRADGTWATPAGGGSTLTLGRVLQYSIASYLN